MKFDDSILPASVIALGAVVSACALAWFGQPSLAATSSDAKAPSVLTVDAVTPRYATWPDFAQGSGPLAAWQEIVVSPETGGLRVAELLVDVGEHVRRGDLLARLDDKSLQADLRKQVAAVAQARASLEQATSNLERAHMVDGSGALSAQKLEEYRINEMTSRAGLDSAQADLEIVQLKLRQTRIVAIDDGVVSSKSAVLGSVVSAGAEMFRLVRQGRVEWHPEMDVRQITGIKVGQVAHVTLPNGQSIDGRVRMIGPTLSTGTGRATIYVTLPSGTTAQPGMFASGTIEFAPRPATVLPQTAVTLRDGRAYVYVISADNTVSSRLVSAGRRERNQVEVDGLPSGIRVVADGGAFLSDGAHVTVAPTPATLRVESSSTKGGLR